MSVNAVLKIKCQFKENHIADLLELFEASKWNFYDSDGYVMYLPFKDNGMYNWKNEILEKANVVDVLKKKKKNEEIIGIVFYRENTDIGVTMLKNDFQEIFLSLDINRKKITADDFKSETDVTWYIKNIIVELKKHGAIIESYLFEEY